MSTLRQGDTAARPVVRGDPVPDMITAVIKLTPGRNSKLYFLLFVCRHRAALEPSKVSAIGCVGGPDGYQTALCPRMHTLATAVQSCSSPSLTQTDQNDVMQTVLVTGREQ